MSNLFSKFVKTVSKRAKELEIEEKLDNLKDMLSEKGLYPKKEEKKKTNPLVIVLAVVGAIAAVAAIAYAVYYFFIPEDSEYFEDFEDFDDEDFFEEDEEDWEGDE